MSGRREIILRNVLSTRLLSLGYNVFLPVFDEGIDLIAHREKDNDLLLIQQKGRWGIFRKYLGRNIWIAFPDRDDWRLVRHDPMLHWPEVAPFLLTSSWLRNGQYHASPLSKALRARCQAEGICLGQDLAPGGAAIDSPGDAGHKTEITAGWKGEG